MSTVWLLGGLCLLPTEAGHEVRRCDLAIDGPNIKAVVPAGDARPDPADEAIDASGNLIAPGFVNAHTHSPDNLIRGSAPNLPLELWSLHSAAGREGRSPRETYVAAMLGCIEMLRGGVTTVLDHIRFSPHPDPAGLDSIGAAYRDAGMRAVIAPVLADRAVVDTMPLDPADLPPKSDDAYGRGAMMPAAEQARLVDDFIQRWHGVEKRIYGAVGPSGPQRCSDELLQLAGDISLRRKVIWHSHVLETKVQREMARRLYGVSMIRHLSDLGVLSRRTNLVHMNWATPDDLDLVAASGAGIVHNPVSNARLGSSVCDLPGILARGIPVGLGTDSACCNDSNNLLETAKWAALTHNQSSPDPDTWVGPDRAMTLATRGGASVLGLGDTTGQIAPGLAADLVLFKIRSPAFAPLINPVQQIVLGAGSADISSVMVAGKFLMRDGRCTMIDESSIWAEAQELADRRLSANKSVYASAANLASATHAMYCRVHGLAYRKSHD